MISPYGVTIDIYPKTPDVRVACETRPSIPGGRTDNNSLTNKLMLEDVRGNGQYEELISHDHNTGLTSKGNRIANLTDFLYEADVKHTNKLVLEAGDGVSLSHLAKTIASFRPRDDGVNGVSIIVRDVQQRTLMEEACSEYFQLVLEQQCKSLGLSRKNLREDGLPLLNLRQEVYIRSVNDTTRSQAMGDYVLSGLRRIAQTVFDTLISVKTDDEDEQAYGEAHNIELR